MFWVALCCVKLPLESQFLVSICLVRCVVGSRQLIFKMIVLGELHCTHYCTLVVSNYTSETSSQVLVYKHWPTGPRPLVDILCSPQQEFPHETLMKVHHRMILTLPGLEQSCRPSNLMAANHFFMSLVHSGPQLGKSSSPLFSAPCSLSLHSKTHSSSRSFWIIPYKIVHKWS